MKIIVGCEALLSPLTGIGYYCHAICSRLNKMSDVELHAYAYGRFHNMNVLLEQQQQTDDESVNRNSFGIFDSVKSIAVKSELVVTLYQQLMPIWEKVKLNKLKDAVYHSPNFLVPKFPGPKCVTIHDLSTLIYPEYHPKARVNLVNNAIETAIEEQVTVITDSEFIRSQLIDKFSIRPDLVHAIHLGADHSFRPRSTDECQQTLMKFGLDYSNFLLTVATIEPRKNIYGLLRAYEVYCSSVKQPLPLVLVGSEGWNSEREHGLIEKLSRNGYLKYYGYVSRPDLKNLFSSASAFLFPSFYEGFGLPVLEAMKSGVPVVTSKNSAMSEIVQGQGIEVEPHDIDAIAASIIQLCSDEKLRRQVSENCLAASEKFCWNKTVQSHLNVYQSLV